MVRVVLSEARLVNASVCVRSTYLHRMSHTSIKQYAPLRRSHVGRRVALSLHTTPTCSRIANSEQPSRKGSIPSAGQSIGVCVRFTTRGVRHQRSRGGQAPLGKATSDHTGGAYGEGGEGGSNNDNHSGNNNNNNNNDNSEGNGGDQIDGGGSGRYAWMASLVALAVLVVGSLQPAMAASGSALDAIKEKIGM